MSSEFEDKVVLVAGLNNRTANEAAQAFAHEGAQVILADRDEASVLSTIKMIQEKGGNVAFVQTDLTSAKEVEALINNIVQSHGKLDMAFNDAAALTDAHHLKMLADYEEQDWDRLMDTHLKAIWLCMKYELLKMRTQPGSAIVNSASALGRSGYAGLAAYSAAQHGVIGLTQAAARQYAPAGIRINAVCPALTAAIEPVVDAILWLCSDRSSFVSGQALVINGGV